MTDAPHGNRWAIVQQAHAKRAAEAKRRARNAAADRALKELKAALAPAQSRQQPSNDEQATPGDEPAADPPG